MQVIGIKELQTNPSKLTKAFQDNDYLLITNHGQPLGFALPFAEGIMDKVYCRGLPSRVSKAGI